MNDKAQVVVGIDVSKASLDVAVLPSGEVLQFANDTNGIEELGRKLKAVDLVVMEATGGYETAVATALVGSGLRVAVVNPRQVRDFAKATGRLAKTDRIDALVIAAFGQAIEPEIVRSASSIGAPSPPWWALRLSIATAASCAVGAPSTAVAPRCARLFTWRRPRRSAATP